MHDNHLSLMSFCCCLCAVHVDKRRAIKSRKAVCFHVESVDWFVLTLPRLHALLEGGDTFAADAAFDVFGMDKKVRLSGPYCKYLRGLKTRETTIFCDFVFLLISNLDDS